MIGAAPPPRRPWNRAERQQVAMATAVVVVPTLGAIAAAALAVVRPPTAVDLALFGAMYAATVLGITAGYHRLVTHRAFQAPSAVRAALVVLGSMAAQGPVLFWTAVHRKHHQLGDRPGDPHSPYGGADGGGSLPRAFWRAHVGWMFEPQAIDDWHRLVPDLLRDPLVVELSRYYPHWLAVGLLAPAVVGGLLDGPMGALSGFLWGGLVRVFAVHHATWSINSVCHMFGRRAYDTPDRSTNHWLAALLAFGEGWHNNHHAFQSSARHGLEWWQPDLTYGLIKALERVGLAEALIVPDEDARARRRAGQPATPEDVA